MKLICLIGIYAIFYSASLGQTKLATTENGEKVILYPNGTWKTTDTSTTGVKSNLDPNDCSNWIKTTEDKVSGNSYTSMKDFLIVSNEDGKKGLGISIMKTSRGIIIFDIKAVGAGSCIDKGAKINFLFTDESRLELFTDGDFNCKAMAKIYFGDSYGKKVQLSEIQNKEIDILRVWTSDGYVEEKFTNSQALHFKSSLNCLLGKN